MITEKEILEKYPKIFKDYNKTIYESCMAWGLEVPDEWLPVVDELCEAIEQAKTISKYVPNYEGPIKFPQVVAEQVKSKFRGFRFYYRFEYEQENVPHEVVREHYSFIDGIVMYAEIRIAKIENERDN